ncbi:MAG: hypothetical protein PUK70_08670 [Bacteroidales bacterium]|nr:hypothetical protein [Bacteroidales bacterium]MDY6001121.1 hypothetical protein [Candidatus Cryptobacteroides sp.]
MECALEESQGALEPAIAIGNGGGGCEHVGGVYAERNARQGIRRGTLKPHMSIGMMTPA